MSWKIPHAGSWYKFINKLIWCTFLWYGRVPRVALDILKLPTHVAGLAFPDFSAYYIASLLVYVYDWLPPSSANACTTVEAAIISSHETLHNIVYRKGSPAWSGHFYTTCLSCIIYKNIKTSVWNTPLWSNLSLPELLTILDTQWWSLRG